MVVSIFLVSLAQADGSSVEYFEPSAGKSNKFHLQRGATLLNLTWAIGLSEFGFRHRHGYGPSVDLTVTLHTQVCLATIMIIITRRIFVLLAAAIASEQM